MEDDILACFSCDSYFCDGDCPEAYEDYERQERAIARHVATCQVDGFCYTCQCL